jgi:organic radical activating enzyme
MKSKTYNIAEIFGPTIQGEGSSAGTSVFFVRFAGCNLRCKFCDTDHTTTYRWTAKSIADFTWDKARAWGKRTAIVFTGGEPMLQLDVALLRAFEKNGMERFHMETNGSVKIPLDIGRRMDHITVSPKSVLNTVNKHIVFTDLKVLFPMPLAAPGVFEEGFCSLNKFVQPVWDREEDKRLANLNACLHFIHRNPSWRISLQLHKMIGVE